MNIVIKDAGNKKYLVYENIADHKELHISNNVNKINDWINDSSKYVLIETIDSRNDIKGTRLENWEEDQGLYEKWIDKHNNAPENQGNVLWAWTR